MRSDLRCRKSRRINRTASARFVLKDIRLFYNSIEHAMDIVRLAGIKIQSRRIETDECTELRILIHKGS